MKTLMETTSSAQLVPGATRALNFFSSPEQNF